MKKNLYYIIYIGILMMFLAGCQDEGLFTSADDEPVNVSYRVKVEDGLQSRAIGDATQVNNLSVLVFDEIGNLVLSQRDLVWSEVQSNGLSLPLFKGTYQVLFWLQYADENMKKPYTITNDGQVTVSYDGWTKNISDVEKWDAFYLVDTLTINNSVQNKSITLTRPVGQLNWATQDSFEASDHQVKVTLSNVATAFQPLTGTVSGHIEFSFTFNDFTNETLTTGEKTYTYLTCNYLFPATLTATFDLQKNDGTSVKKVENLDDIKIEKNKRTNVLGSIVQEPEAPAGWDGETLTQPELVEGHYIIDESSDLAWLTFATNVETLTGNIFEVTKDIDMNCTEETGYTISSLQLKEGSTFIGGGYTIKYFANSFFGNATNLTVQNLVLDNVHAVSDGHVGVLVNTLTGSSTFTGVTIANSSATTSNGAAGGMIGYIKNKEGETLEVTFSGCTATNNEVNGSKTSGVYVGRFRGYDNSETLTFSSCNGSSTTIMGTNPYYVEGNEATWLAENDYSNYSGWLGNEEYYRGTINYGNDRFIPKWDGTAKVEPLKDGNTILIYSAFDLATLQGATPTAVTFKTNVDLGSHKFKPIYSVQTLEGENNTVYNLTVLMEKHDGMGAAFIQSAPTGKVNVSHKNLILIGADVKNYHDTSLYPAFGVTNDGGAGNAYGGIFISKANSCESYTIDNIHVKDSKLYAVCKMGGIIGQSVGTKLYMSNCSVDNCIIQNYKPNVPNYYVLGDDSQPWMVKSSLYINLLQWWYTNGEAGGLIGFLQNSDSDIDNCSVTNTQINCSGQDNKTVVANVYSENQFDRNNLWKANKTITAKGETTIAGRHVNQFIGDVVSYSSTEGGTNYTVDITNYTVSGNSYNGTLAESTNKYNHQYDKSGDKYGTNANLYCEVVGCAYYIGLDIIVIGQNLGHLKYYAGNVAFSSKDGQTNGSFTEASGEGDNINIAWTGGNFKITGALLFVRSEYPTEPARKDPEY